MIHWVLYDISDSSQRNHIVRLLKDYGLSRRQKSVFLGKLTPNDRKVLIQELNDLFQSDNTNGTDIVYIIPLCNACFEKIYALGVNPPMITEFDIDTLII